MRYFEKWHCREGESKRDRKKIWTIDTFSWFENSKFPIGHKIRIDIIELCRSCDYNGRSHRKTQWTVESINTFVIFDAQAKMQSQHIFAFVILLRILSFCQTKIFFFVCNFKDILASITVSVLYDGIYPFVDSVKPWIHLGCNQTRIYHLSIHFSVYKLDCRI